MKISDRRLRISVSLKISDFSNSLGVLQHPQAPPAIRLWLGPPSGGLQVAMQRNCYIF